MTSTLTVLTPATDRSLLTLDELRAAVGIADGSQDAALATLGRRVSDTIASACRVAAGGAVPPTLREEVLSEIFRWSGWDAQSLILARRPATAVASVSDTTGTVSTDAYELAPSAGMVIRLDGCWPCASRLTVVYTAGWATVPEDLKLAASKLATTLWTETTRDPSLKRERVDGVGEREYWVGPSDDPLIPAEVMDLLAPYRNLGIG